MKILFLSFGFVAVCVFGCGKSKAGSPNTDNDTAKMEFMGGDNLGDLGGVEKERDPEENK